MSRDTALAVIESCGELDVRLSVLDDGRLAATGWLNDALRAAIRGHKDDIVALLRLDATSPEIPSESALVHVPLLGREIWIASDSGEADRLRLELAPEGDDRPVIVADDVLKLEGQPLELITAGVRALAAFPGARWVSTESSLPDLPAGATGAVSFEFSDGALIRERVFGTTVAELKSTEPLVVEAAAPRWNREAQAVIDSFLVALEAGDLPTEPFNLWPHVTVLVPVRWYSSLRIDIAVGARGPRAAVLVEELRRLRDLVGGGERRGLEIGENE